MGTNSGLSGITVLVVEDDFYLADDARQALEDAGASVLGPCATAAEAFALIGGAPPGCAVVDVNLGEGPSFGLARAIIARGIPMLFATGYDASSIPPDLADLPRLQKPLDLHKLVVVVEELRRNKIEARDA